MKLKFNFSPFIKVLCLTTMLVASSINKAQTNVVAIKESKSLPENFITYFLPKTEIMVVADVAISIEKAGRFANYTKRFLELNNIVIKDKTAWELKKITLQENCIPDSSKQYAIEVNSKTIAYKIELTDRDVIMCVNCNQNNNYQGNSSVVVEDVDTAINFNYSFLNEDVLNATSEEKMAELTAKQILYIRESRMELLTGSSEHSYDGNALAKMLKELDEAETKLTELFIGKKIEYTKKEIFRILPDRNLSNEVVFRFSPLLGVIDKDNYAGYPIYISATINPNANAYDRHKVKMNRRNGIFYNIPNMVEVVVTTKDKVLAKRLYTMPQFSKALALPAKIFNNHNTSVVFSKYGTIKNIK